MFSNIKLVAVLILVGVIAFSIMTKSPDEASEPAGILSSEQQPLDAYDASLAVDTAQPSEQVPLELPQAPPALPVAQPDEPAVAYQQDNGGPAIKQQSQPSEPVAQPPSEDLTGLY